MGSIWESIKSRIVSAAKSVKEGVVSVAGRAKGIILLNGKLQAKIDNCVGNLKNLPKSAEELDKGEREAFLLNSVLKAFRDMSDSDVVGNFLEGRSSEKKGFAGFVNFLKSHLENVKVLDSTKNVDGDTLDNMKIKILKVLSHVRKYSGVGSRVKDFVDPCEKLHYEIINIGADSQDEKFDSYFDKASAHLKSAATKKSGEGEGFRKSMCNAYDAVFKMCKYEKLGEKSDGDKKKVTASGKWYNACSEDKITTEGDKVKAVLVICNYNSDRGVFKRFLKFKGQTKWQKLQAYVAKVKNNGVKNGLINENGELIAENDNNSENSNSGPTEF